jgi:hypothetical protein
MLSLKTNAARIFASTVPNECWEEIINTFFGYVLVNDVFSTNQRDQSSILGVFSTFEKAIERDHELANEKIHIIKIPLNPSKPRDKVYISPLCSSPITNDISVIQDCIESEVGLPPKLFDVRILDVDRILPVPDWTKESFADFEERCSHLYSTYSSEKDTDLHISLRYDFSVFEPFRFIEKKDHSIVVFEKRSPQIQHDRDVIRTAFKRCVDSSAFTCWIITYRNLALVQISTKLVDSFLKMHAYRNHMIPKTHILENLCPSAPPTSTTTKI